MKKSRVYQTVLGIILVCLLVWALEVLIPGTPKSITYNQGGVDTSPVSIVQVETAFKIHVQGHTEWTEFFNGCELPLEYNIYEEKDHQTRVTFQQDGNTFLTTLRTSDQPDCTDLEIGQIWEVLPAVTQTRFIRQIDTGR